MYITAKVFPFQKKPQVKLLADDAGIKIDSKKLDRDVEELIAFETKYAKIIVPEEDRHNYTTLYNLRKLDQLNKLMPVVSQNYSNPGRSIGTGTSAR